MRVEVKIPGSLESYCIDERGDKRVATESLWLETFLCGVLRAYSYADDGSGDTIKKIVGVRRFNPVVNTETEHKFLEAAEKLFFNGSNAPIRQFLRYGNYELTVCREAIEFRSRNPSTEYCLKSSHIGPFEVHTYHWALRLGYKPF